MKKIKRNKHGQFVKGSGSPRENPIFITCKKCGKKFRIVLARINTAKYCSRACKHLDQHGSHHGGWGKYGIGKSINKHGYFRVFINKKWIYEHRHVMEKHLGRKLQRGEVIHHKDGNRQNNQISNLKIMNKIEHDRFETTKRQKNGYFSNKGKFQRPDITIERINYYLNKGFNKNQIRKLLKTTHNTITYRLKH